MSRKKAVEQLQNEKRELFDKDVLNVLNGQAMYEEFKAEKLMKILIMYHLMRRCVYMRLRHKFLTTSLFKQEQQDIMSQ